MSHLSKNERFEDGLSGQTSCVLSDLSSAHLLQRLSPIDYQEIQATQLAAPLVKAKSSSDWITVLIFRLSQEWFALPAQLCRQVLAPIPAHTLPYRSNSTLIGVVNVSGQMLLKVSLLDLLGLDRLELDLLGGRGRNLSDVEAVTMGDSDSPNSPSHRHEVYPRMVVVESAGPNEREVWAFDVDELEGVCSLETDCLELPAVGQKVSASCTRQVFCWQDTFVSLLDDQQLFEALRQRAL